MGKLMNYLVIMFKFIFHLYFFYGQLCKLIIISQCMMTVLCELLDDWHVRYISAKDRRRGGADGTLLGILSVGLD